jgi:hypothetical protein
VSTAPNIINIHPPAAHVPIPVFAAMTGYSEKAIQRKIERGEWHEGDQYRRGADGEISISLEGFERWCEGKAAPPAPPTPVATNPKPARKPVPSGATSLYRHFDGAGRLLYVGVSLDAVARLGRHVRFAAWTAEIARVDVERFPTREAALAAERAAIKAERPLHNIIHAVKP